MRVATRGFVGKRKIFEDLADVDLDDDLATLALAASHAQRMLDYPEYMIEIEFLEETNQQERFFRFRYPL